MAGNRAGLAYNTWPFMENDQLIPTSFWDFRKNGLNHFFEDTGAVQFVHRTLAYTTTFSILSTAAYANYHMRRSPLAL